MYCPFCSYAETKVLESRLVDNSLRRRRECLKCQNRFTTYEKASFNFTVLKKDRHEEPFNLEKIKNGLRKACSKRQEEEIGQLAKKIEQKILAKKINCIKTSEIGKLVLKELKNFDQMAYLRFASVHKSIDDPQLLRKDLSEIIAKR